VGGARRSGKIAAGAAAAAVGLARRRPGLVLAGFACLLVLFSASSFFSTRLDQSGDLTYHLHAEGQVARALETGGGLFGPIAMNFGTPVLKFYQPLLYLITPPLHWLLGIDLLLLHNLLIVLLFACTPLALLRAYRALGLSDATAGLAALLSLLSVAGFGSSFEAFFTLGVINQVLGAVLFPLFIGQFCLLLKRERGPVGAAALFGLTFVAHVMMAIYSVFTGALLFLVNHWDLRRLWKPLLVFSILAALLVVFWMAPFVSYRSRFRPVPDVVALPHDAHYTTGLTAGQATRLLFSGRLLDDARTANRGQQNADDRLLDKMSIAGTLRTRPPVFTILALLGLALCLFRLRSLPHRFLVAGFVFSFLLLMGPDDVGWLNLLPFSQRIQFFRCVYLLEFFAFGLAAAGLEIIGRFAWERAGQLALAPRRTIRTGVYVAAAGGLVLVIHLTLVLADTHVNPGSAEKFERAYRIAKPMAEGTPLRAVLENGHFRTDKRRIAYMGFLGQHTVCGHWRIVGPTIANDLCRPLRNPGTTLSLARKLGIAYYLVNRKRAKLLNEVENPDGTPALRQINRGHGHYLYHDGRARFFWAARPAVLVVADDVQWFHLIRAWIKRMSRRDGAEPPTPVRVGPETGLAPDLLAAVDAVWVLAPEALGPGQREALAGFAASGKRLLSVTALPGIDAEVLDPGGPALLDSFEPASEPDGSPTIEQLRAAVGGPVELDVQAGHPAVLVVPDFAMPGWQATIDGAEAPSLAAGPDLLATVVPAGRHRVRFRWEAPGSEILGMLVSGAAWAGIAVFVVVQRVRRRRSR